MNAFNEERVLSVHHWNESLFSFTTTRNAGFRFRNGHFVMMGLEVEGRPLLRAFSLAAADYDEHLEFYSIKIPDGALTSRLQHVESGHRVLVGRKPTGTLLVENLRPGKRLYLLATGTGLAPFLSIIRDPATYERYETVVLAHGVRRASDLAYQSFIEDELPHHELVGEQVRQQLLYYPTVTREPYRNQGRISDLIESGKLSRNLSLPALDAEHDRFMLCGSPGMLKDLVAILEAKGFDEANSDRRGSYVIERAFVQK
ncbi:MAG TPA: ferredoxin--NADP reductase [Polyangiaceae bacterium]|nr:ferredoxin--NADP reductase [Polyangiaceae bacterium]